MSFAENEQQNLLEQQKARMKNLLSPKYDLLPWNIELTPHKPVMEPLTPSEYAMYQQIRPKIQAALNTLGGNTDRTCILAELRTDYVVGALDLFYKHGLDCYPTLSPIPTNSSNLVEQTMKVGLDQEQEIQAAKETLTENNLKGVMFNIDPLAWDQLQEVDLKSLLPTSEQLRSIGITNIVVLADISAEATRLWRLQMEHPRFTHPIFQYTRNRIQDGFTVDIRGLHSFT
jgi:hypothetical protein